MNMLSSVTPWDMVAQGYSEVTMQVFQGYVDAALEQTHLNKESHILDIACGPGTLTLKAANKTNSVKAIDFSQTMIDILNDTIQHQSIDNIDTYCGDAQQLPYEDDSFDVAFSMFGLMFFPDRMKAYKEIYRTLKPGGKTVISSWAPTTDSPMQMAMFGAVKAIKPDVPEPQTDIESLENPEFFKAELVEAGFKDVEIIPVVSGIQVDSIEQFWVDMVKGSAPLVMLQNSMPEEAWQEKSKIAIGYLCEILPDLPATLTAKAWIGVGVK